MRLKFPFPLTEDRRFRLTMLTRDPSWAAAGCAAGIDLIGVDVERLGKVARQAHISDARINDHELSDLPILRRAAPTAKLWARLNPLHCGSQNEIDSAIAFGAQVLTQPQFRTGADVEEFRGLVAGRARIIPLLEDAAALNDLDAVLKVCGDDEMMVGLNDLARSLGLKHPLQLAVSPILGEIGHAARKAGVAWGFGGVAAPYPRPDLPIQPDDLLSRYATTGATAAWISRSMMNAIEPDQLSEHVDALRGRLSYWRSASTDALAAAEERLERQIARMIKDMGHD